MGVRGEAWPRTVLATGLSHGSQDAEQLVKSGTESGVQLGRGQEISIRYFELPDDRILWIDSVLRYLSNPEQDTSPLGSGPHLYPEGMRRVRI